MSTDFVTQVTGRLGKLVNDGADRWLLALAESRQRSYTSGKLISDMVMGWADTADAWLFPFGLLLPPSAPIVAIPITVGTTNDASGVAPIPSHAPGALQSDPLNGPGGKSILSANVAAEVTTDGSAVIVKLTGLNALNLIKGLYVGDVGLPNDVVANVRVTAT
jgi:hypothetical protein